VTTGGGSAPAGPPVGSSDQEVGPGRPAVGVVVVTHGCAAADLVGAAEAIVGRLPEVTCLATGPCEAAGSIQRRVARAASAADQGGGVLLITDLHGSTPANACLALHQPGRIEVLFGVNLAMLIKLSTCDRREVGPTELGEFLRDTGRRSIRLAAELKG